MLDRTSKPCQADASPKALPETGVFHVADWRIDQCARTASDGERVRQLSPRAVLVLRALGEAGGHVVTRRDLMAMVWPNVTVGDDSLTQAIAELRRALGDGCGKSALIQTVPKSGYRLAAPYVTDQTEASPAGDAEAFDLTAYLLWVEARQAMLRSGPNAVESIEALCREATSRCPQFALAHADLAVALANHGLFRAGARDRLKEALSVAEDAVALRPDLGYTHAAHGFVLGALDRFDASRKAFARAFQRDANDGEAHYLAARTAFVAGDYKASLVLAGRTAELSNDGPRSLFIAARAAIALNKEESARYARKCHARVMSVLALDPNSPRANQALAPTLAMMGEVEAARAAMAAQEASCNTLGYHSLLGRVLLGDIDVALDLCEELIDHGWRDGTGIASEPIIGQLAGETRFRKLVGALN